MKNTGEILKNSTTYALATVIAQVIGVFTSIATRRLLTPEMMGIWATFLIVLNYCLFAHIGVFTAVGVRIPYLRGKEKEEEIQAMRDTAYTFAVMISAFVVIILLIASFMLKNRFDAYITLGIRVVAFVIAATFFYNLYTVMLRADKKFHLLSKALIVNSASMLFFVVILAYFFGLRGIYFATFSATVISWLYLRYGSGYKLKLGFKLKQLVSLTKIGLPILIVGIAYTLLVSIDKIMIIKMIGARELGFYSIAILAFTYTNTFPKLFGIVIFPNMQEDYGKTDSKDHIIGYVKKPAIIMAYIFPVLLAAAYFAIPVLVYYILPKYIPGITSMKILLAGCFFISLTPLAQNFAISINKQTVLIPMTIAAVVLGLGLNYFMIKSGYGINGVALGTSVAYMVYFVILFYYVLKHCEKRSNILKFIMGIFLPFVYAFAIILLLERCFHIKNIFLGAIVKASIFIVVYSPMVIYLNKKTGIITKLIKRKTSKKIIVEPEAPIGVIDSAEPELL
ncbi:MAG: oligosaccharide flippase family protein [Candidatus Omnitrophica bacterium]|nr:oligosaccharide flippase family protein [Candidatus Omnitrophota bacterium]